MGADMGRARQGVHAHAKAQRRKVMNANEIEKEVVDGFAADVRGYFFTTEARLE